MAIHHISHIKHIYGKFCIFILPYRYVSELWQETCKRSLQTQLKLWLDFQERPRSWTSLIYRIFSHNQSCC